MDEEWLSGAAAACGDHARHRPLRPPGERRLSRGAAQASRHCRDLEAWKKAATDARSEAIFELREAGLLLSKDKQAPDALDAHPLAREWFGEKFKTRKREPAATRRMAGFTIICAIRPRRAIRPRTSPRWSRCSRPLRMVARPGGSRRRSTMFIQNRICRRRPDGRLAFHAQDSLGSIGPLPCGARLVFRAAVRDAACGPDSADDDPGFSAQRRIFSALSAAWAKRATTQRATLEMTVAAKDWPNAAQVAANLADAELALGDIAAAVGDAARGVELRRQERRRVSNAA